MSVTGTDTRLVFCEGKPDSLDAQLLNRMTPSSATQVVPCGGKYGLRAFIEGRLAPFSTPPAFIAFRDRDFDAEPPDTPGLIPLSGQKPIFLSHRSCIESYLLEPALIHRYWLKNSKAESWQHGPPPESEELAVWIEEAARAIADYQAVRWALASLKPGERWPEVLTRWTKGSGDLPPSLDLTTCLEEAQKLVAAFRQEVGGVSPEALDARAKEYGEQFASKGFWKAGRYTVWFHGKDLKKSIQKHEKVSISMNHFCTWAVDHLSWDDHVDLEDLARKLE